MALTRARGQTEVFVGKDQASGLPALAEQMSRQSDRGATLRYVVEKERLNEQILSPERGYEREI